MIIDHRDNDDDDGEQLSSPRWWKIPLPSQRPDFTFATARWCKSRFEAYHITIFQWQIHKSVIKHIHCSLFRDSGKLRHHSRSKLIFYNHKEDWWALFWWSMIIDHLSMINDEDYAKSDAGLCRPWLRSVTSLFLLIISSSFFLIIYWSSSLSSFWSSLIIFSSFFLIFYWSAPLLPK